MKKKFPAKPTDMTMKWDLHNKRKVRSFFFEAMITELWCENNINQKKLMSFESEAQKIPTVKTNF